MLTRLEMLCIFYWLHDGEAKGTVTGLLVTGFIDASLVWEASWEYFQTEEKDLLTNDINNSTFHSQIFCLFCFHQIFVNMGIKGWGSSKRALSRKFLKSKVTLSNNAQQWSKKNNHTWKHSQLTQVCPWAHMLMCWDWNLQSCILQKDCWHNHCGLHSSPHSNSYAGKEKPQIYDILTFIRLFPSLILPQSML